MRPALRSTFHALQFAFGLLLLASLITSVFTMATPAGKALAGALAAGLAYQLVRVVRFWLAQRSDVQETTPSQAG